MEKKSVAVLGASGYTGSDLLRFLITQPKVEVTYATAEKHAGKRISEVLPHLRNFLKLELQPLDVKSIPDEIEIVFAALPHGASAKVVEELIERGKRVVDLGADFRLSHRVQKVDALEPADIDAAPTCEDQLADCPDPKIAKAK